MLQDQDPEHDLRRELIEAIKEKSLEIHPSADIRLSSGQFSPYYVNMKNLLLTQEGRRIVGALLASHLEGIQFKAVGGPEVGGLLAALAYSDHQDRVGRPMQTFFVRKKPKGYGNKAVDPIERPGDLRRGDEIIAIDDVVTSGDSLLNALQEMEKFGFKIVKVVAVLDREEGGTESLIEKGYNYSYLVTLKELIQESDEHRQLEAVTQ